MTESTSTEEVHEITDAPEQPDQPTIEEMAEENLNLRLALGLGLDPRMIMQEGFTITSDGSPTITLTWESKVGVSMEFFNEVVSHLAKNQPDES